MSQFEGENALVRMEFSSKPRFWMFWKVLEAALILFPFTSRPALLHLFAGQLKTKQLCARPKCFPVALPPLPPPPAEVHRARGVTRR